VRIRAGRAGRAVVRVLHGGQVAGRATASIGASGRAEIRVRLRARGLRAARRATLQVRVAFTPAAGGGARRAEHAVTLRR
jgi:hypothetical protein